MIKEKHCFVLYFEQRTSTKDFIELLSVELQAIKAEVNQGETWKTWWREE